MRTNIQVLLLLTILTSSGRRSPQFCMYACMRIHEKKMLTSYQEEWIMMATPTCRILEGLGLHVYEVTCLTFFFWR